MELFFYCELTEGSNSLFVTAVNEGSVQDNLLLLIQELGEYLTNDDEFIRAKGRCFSSTLVRDSKLIFFPTFYSYRAPVKHLE